MEESVNREVLGLKSGRLLSDTVRCVWLDFDSPVFAEIARIEAERRASGLPYLFISWHIQRDYEEVEIAAAELFYVFPPGTSYFEPAGEECGTVYDETTACPHCGHGRRMIGNLRLRRVRKNKDFMHSIGGENVVSDRFADGFSAAGLTGARFRTVYKGKRGETAFPGIKEIIVDTGATVHSRTKTVRSHPLDPDPEGEFRCPLGHAIGMKRLSEVFIERASYSGGDLVQTAQCIGWKMGLLRAEPLMLASPRFLRFWRENGLKGLRFEIAHLV